MAWYHDIAEGASDLAAVGLQVTKGVGSAGLGILKGMGTAVVNPKKFISDVGQNLSTWKKYMDKSTADGMAMIQEGVDDVKKGGSKGLLFVKAMAGMHQITSFGLSAKINEHMAENVEEVTDELGNVSGYQAKEGADALTRVSVKWFGQTAANTKNMNNEIEEALDAGETEKANKIFGKAALAAGGKAIKVGGVIAGVALAVPTGGLSLGVMAKSFATYNGIKMLTSAVGNKITEHSEVAFDEINLEDDISDMKADYVKAALDAGQITEAEAEEYGRIIETVYANATYKSMDPEAIQKMGYANAEEMTSAILQAYGYDTGGRAVVDLTDEDRAALYKEQFMPYVESGQYTDEQADALAHLQVAYEKGEMDLRTYSRSAAYVTLTETSLSDAEKSAYCDKIANFMCGSYTEEDLAASLKADPLIGKYVSEDGTVSFPDKEGAAHSYSSTATDAASELSDAKATLQGAVSAAVGAGLDIGMGACGNDCTVQADAIEQEDEDTAGTGMSPAYA